MKCLKAILSSDLLDWLMVMTDWAGNYIILVYTLVPGAGVGSGDGPHLRAAARRARAYRGQVRGRRARRRRPLRRPRRHARPRILPRVRWRRALRQRGDLDHEQLQGVLLSVAEYSIL